MSTCYISFFSVYPPQSPKSKIGKFFNKFLPFIQSPSIIVSKNVKFNLNELLRDVQMRIKIAEKFGNPISVLDALYDIIQPSVTPNTVLPYIMGISFSEKNFNYTVNYLESTAHIPTAIFAQRGLVPKTYVLKDPYLNKGFTHFYNLYKERYLQ